MTYTRLPTDEEMRDWRQAGALVCQCATPDRGPGGECLNGQCQKLIAPVNGSAIAIGQNVVCLIGPDALAERIVELLNDHGVTCGPYDITEIQP